MSFEEGRRSKKCFKCAAPWSRGHKCSSEAIRHNVRNRLAQGHKSAHIVSDLVLTMEGDIESPTGSERNDPVADIEVNFQDSVDLFDSLTATNGDEIESI
eukprot:IDg4859t1